MSKRVLNVLPLFPSTLFYSYLDELDTKKIIEIVENKFTFFKSENVYDNGIYLSESKNILDFFPDLKQLIVDSFSLCAFDVLKFKDCDFKITTSWITRSVNKSYTHFHRHKNSFYSGVLYLNGGMDFSPIEFATNSEFFGSFLIDSSEKNIYNSENWEIIPEEKKLIFFPSNLSHRICYSLSDCPRYSLAFNIFPFGTFGVQDSAVKIVLE